MMTLRDEDMEFMRGKQEYWRQVNETDGFDLENVSVPQATFGLLPFDCEREGVRFGDPQPQPLSFNDMKPKSIKKKGKKKHLEKMTLGDEDMEFMRGQQEYWRQVNETDGFDLENVSVPQGTIGLLPFDCEREGVRFGDPQPLLVRLYARLGLHRYNMSKGTNYVLHHLKKYNMKMNCVSSYYITLVACDPATPTSLVTFQVGVSEKAYGRLYVRCSIARRLGDPKEPSEPLDVGGGVLPIWPSDFSDTKQFWLLKESELQGSDDWIRLYLELALCANDRWLSDSLLSKLQILNVAIKEDVEPLQAKSASVYITFKGLARARFGELGEHVERRVIIKIHERPGCLTVIGGFGFAIGEKVEKNLLGIPRGEWRFGDPLPCPPPTTLPVPNIDPKNYLHLFNWRQ